MGYESKLFIVEKSSYIDADHPRFCYQLAQYDLAVFPPISSLFQKDSSTSHFTDCGIYLDGDGNKQVIEDCYGDKLREASLEAVIEVLKTSSDKNYRRIPPILAMLESFSKMKTKGDFKDMVVIHYGH